MAILFLTVSAAHAQRRDYLTEAEISLVREAQQIDLRVAVLSTAVERRMSSITGAKPPVKDESKWGVAPEGTRLEMLRDIEGLLQKAIDDIDDLAAREPESKFFPAAVRKLLVLCESLAPRLKSLGPPSVSDMELASIVRTSEKCSDVVEAAAKLPKESKGDSKKKL